MLCISIYLKRAHFPQIKEHTTQNECNEKIWFLSSVPNLCLVLTTTEVLKATLKTQGKRSDHKTKRLEQVGVKR